jgi:hypothetical protein
MVHQYEGFPGGFASCFGFHTLGGWFMRNRIAAGTSLAIVALLSATVVAADLKSGPQVGDDLVPFEPLNVTGPAAGAKRCLV